MIESHLTLIDPSSLFNSELLLVSIIVALLIKRVIVSLDIAKFNPSLFSSPDVFIPTTHPFLLINGDILTTLDYSKLFEYSKIIDSDIVVGVKDVTAPFEFGQIISNDNYIIDIHEKPDLKIEILSGIYLLKPHIIDLVPENTYYGIDTLIKDMVSRKMKVAKYKIKDYWLDIGRIEDYSTAQDAYNEYFSNE